jgi:hypothetical protein
MSMHGTLRRIAAANAGSRQAKDSLAGASYASNLIYAIMAVRNDLNWLYDKCEALRARIDALPSDPCFATAISALALGAMHTSVESRLKRLARIVVTG